MTEFADRYWTSRDGLKLHFRDYPGRAHRPPIVCLHALTRNARDFAPLAGRLAGEWRVLCPEMRGRGESDYANDASTYNLTQYVEDLQELLDQEGIGRFVSIGTALGGLMTMMLALTAPERIIGAVLNDVGPNLEPAGLERVRQYVGQWRNFPTWLHAARGIEETHGHAYATYQLTDWLAMAKRLMSLSNNGRIVFDYDMKIAEPLADMDAQVQPDLWRGLKALAGKPVLIVRGGLSDIFSQETLGSMVRCLPGAQAITIEGVGHVPTLTEPPAAAAIDRFLQQID